ncbi:MAG TPA: phosphoenolpyruvate carboxykinase (ATP), partial [Bacteroidota bacterium]|nr:phosphoenolpyruvate carboxykinase (ATP) [Bacteroidota bacterium]
RAIDLDNATLTENTRAAYPLSFIGNHVDDGRGNHPRHVIMLTCDASGVMPPIARLSPQQAMYYFLSGYTAKVAGTEKGLGKDPQSTFSTCFGAPFMPLAPTLYAQMLGERLAKHGTGAWLVNTGWSGGPYGTGSRIRIDHTRAMVRAALAGSLNDIPMEREPYFGILVPRECPGVPSEILMPRNSWKDRAAYDRKAAELAGKFRTNFVPFSTVVPPDVLAAGPR